MALQPDLATIRRVPWLERTALVLCDVVDEDDGRAGRGVAPPHPAAPGRARPRRSASRCNFAPSSSSSCSASRSTKRRRKGYTNLTPHSHVIEDYHILQTTRDEYLIRAIRNGMDGAGVPVEFSKGEAGRGQHEINLVVRRARSRWPTGTSSTRTAPRRSPAQHGRSITFMAKYSIGRGRLVVPRALEPVGPRDRRQPLMWDDGDAPTTCRRRSAAGSAASSRAARELAWMFAPDRQLLQALPARVVGADRARVERRQPHVRLPHRRPRRRRSGSSRASPAPT